MKKEEWMNKEKELQAKFDEAQAKFDANPCTKTATTLSNAREELKNIIEMDTMAVTKNIVED